MFTKPKFSKYYTEGFLCKQGRDGDGLEQLEKFNALKASKPEIATEIEDHMEFAVEEEETVS